MRDMEVSNSLLDWYDRSARVLPWRTSPADREAGLVNDPYRVWLSEVMLQQTTVAAVRAYFLRFTTLWPNVTALAEAEDAEVMGEWAGLGYYARARNLLKCARVVAFERGGVFPDTEEELLTLPGVGPYTAAAIASIAFDRPAVVMDGNVERVMARLFAVEEPLPASKPVLKDFAARLTPELRPGDHAQAVMDLGATICTPKNPACGICPVQAACLARPRGIATELPRKTPKKPKPTRLGIAYLARREDGAYLLETRPDRGLLGGMLGWPCTDWAEAAPDDTPPFSAEWHDPDLEVRHTFTHFHLRMALRLAIVPEGTQPNRGAFQPLASFQPSSLPTVMRKAFDLAQGAWPEH